MLLKTLLAFMVPAVAQAAFVVEDPDHVLAKMQSWQNMPTFETAMTCGQNTMIDFETLHCDVKCSDQYCESKCEDAHDRATAFYGLHVDECTQDLAHVFGDNGLIIDVSKADYVASGNSYVIPFLRSVGLFVQPEGKITIKDGFPRQVNMIINGKMKSVFAYDVSGYIDYGQTQKQGFDLLVTDQLDGIRQILQFSMDSDVFFRVRGLIDPMKPRGSQ